MEALISIFISILGAPSLGSYVELNRAQQVSLSYMAAEQIQTHYLPAKTHFRLLHTPKDFGKVLLQELREQGYAITEYVKPPSKKDKCLPSRSWNRLAHMVKCKPEPSEPVHTNSSALSFGFVVDVLTDDLYRLTLVIDNRPMTRAFRLDILAVEPVGQWAVMELGP